MRTLRWLWVGLAAALVTISWISLRDMGSNNSVEIFLRGHPPEVEAQDELRRRFGEGRFAVLAYAFEGPVPAGSLPGLNDLAVRLAAIEGVRTVLHPQIERPRSAGELRDLEGTAPLARTLRLSTVDAGRYALVIVLEERSRGQRMPIWQRVEDLARELAPATTQVHFSGQDLIDRALDRSGQEVGARLMPLLIAAMALFLFALYRDVRTVLALLLAAAASLALALGVLGLLSQEWNLLTVILPVLLLALTIALAVHVVTHVKNALQRGESLDAALGDAVRVQFRPCLMTALTTSLAFASFGWTSIQPLRDLGVAMSLSILIAFALGFTLLPALLSLLRAHPAAGIDLATPLARFAPRLTQPARRVLVPSLLCLLGAVAALPRLRVETNGLLYFQESARIRRDTEWLEQNVGGLASLELILEVAEGIDEWSLIDRVEPVLAALPHVQGVLSPKTLLEEALVQKGMPVTPASLALAAAAARAGLAKGTWFEAYHDSHRGVRLTLLVETVGRSEYHALRDALAAALVEIEADTPGTEIQVAGVYALIMRVQDELLRTLGVSLATTWVSILVLLGLLLRSARATLHLLLPTLLPLAAAVALCPLLDCPLSIGTVMVFSVTLGISVDDSIHVLYAVRHRPGPGALPYQVGEAVTVTTVVIITGFATLALSSFLPTRFFGILTSAAMVMAWWANVAVLPATLRRFGTP